jgi:hypothetical protein
MKNELKFKNLINTIILVSLCVTSNSAYASLSDIMFFDENVQSFVSVDGFEPDKLEYDIVLPWGTKLVPAVKPILEDKVYQLSVYEQVLDNLTKVVVLEEEGGTPITYNLRFSNEKTNDSSLSNIFLNGAPLEGFSPEVFNYDVKLPFFTTQVPFISYEKATKDGITLEGQNVVVSESGLKVPATLKVTAEDGVSVSTYTLNFSVDAPMVVIEADEHYAYLYGISAPNLYPAFNPNLTQYIAFVNDINDVTYEVDAYQCAVNKEVVSQNKIVFEVVNLIDNTVKTQYTVFLHYNNEVDLNVESSSAIKTIKVNGVEATRNGDRFSVTIVGDNKVRPEIDIEGEVEEQAYEYIWSKKSNLHVVKIRTFAQDGSNTTYTLQIRYKKSDDTTLKNINVDGYDIKYTPDRTMYYVSLPSGVEFPNVSYTKQLDTQKVEMYYENNEILVIKVTAENGVDTQTYKVTFMQRHERTSALLESLELTNVRPIQFSPDTFDYTTTYTGVGQLEISYKKDSDLDYVYYTQEGDLITLTVYNLNGYASRYNVHIKNDVTTDAEEVLDDFLITANNGLISVKGSEFTILNVLGDDVTSMNGGLSQGIYIVNLDNKSVKIMMR